MGNAEFPEDRFVNVPNVPVFDEHETVTGNGRELKFGYQELKAVSDRCNRRIADTGDFTVLTLGHNPSEQAKAFGAQSPPVVGFAGPFRMGHYKDATGQLKYTILTDFHIYRDDWEEVQKRYPRRSPELWGASDQNYSNMFLDPIALLGAETPRLDMGLVRYKRTLPRDADKYHLIEKYAAAFPGPIGVHIPGLETKDYEASTTMLSPEDLGAIVEAIQALPVWQYMEGMMQQGEAEGATPLDTVGDAMPAATPSAGPAGITPPAAPAASPTMPPAMPPAPPMAKSPMAPGAPPAAGPLDAPGGEPGLDAPGGESGLDAPGGDEPAAEPKPPMPASPDKEKEKNAMAFQSKYAALDAMSDDEFNAYAAQRYGAGAKSYSADGGSTPEGNIDPDGEDADAGSYSEKPPGSDGTTTLNTGGGPTPKKTEHTVTTYQRDADKALHYRLATVEAELAAAKKEKQEEHHKRVDAERQGLIQHYHMCGWLADPDKAFEKLCYAKVQADEDFHGLLELFVQGSPKIPVGRTVPNIVGAETVMYERAREKASGKKTPEQYAKEKKAVEAVERRVNAETKQGRRPDTTGWLAEEMAKLNGSAA